MVNTIWLTPKEAATHARCEVITLRRAVRAKRLQAFRVNGGRHVRYRVEDIDRWLASSPVLREAVAS